MSRHGKPKSPRARQAPRVPPPPAPPPATPPAPAGSALSRRWPRGTQRRLRAELERFAMAALGDDVLMRTLVLYRDKTGLQDDAFVSEEAELPSYLEWLINDYETDQGDRLIDRYARERAPNRGDAEREMLALWRTQNHLRLLEVQAVWPNRGVVAEDLLTGEKLEVADHSASRSVLRWTLLLARAQTGDQRYTFTGSIMQLSPRHKEALLTAVGALWDGYRSQNPGGSDEQFARRHSLAMIEAARARQALDHMPPVIRTEEGHEVVDATAEFDLADGRAAVARLHEAQEFEYLGPSPAQSGALQFAWLLGGRTILPLADDYPEGAVILRTELRTASGAPALRSVGDVLAWTDRLRLKCLSRERLAAGRQLLESLLGPGLRHREDRFESLEVDAVPDPSRQRGAAPGARPDQPRRREIERQYLEHLTDEWLSEPIPALDGQSPREAIRTAEGRAKTVQLLKTLDYHDQLHRRRGQRPTMNLARIRRELGLPPEPR